MHPLPQALIQKYEVRGTLGSGAMGTVLEAMDRVIERRVAIKLVRRPSDTDAEGLEAQARFRREAQAAGRLAHANIVSVYDYGESAEAAWIVMELVEGGSLKARLDRHERFPLPEIVRLMEQVCAALAYSHQRGVVHRDIKPANIMLTADGTVKIADFGIARIENSSMTQVGTLIGTPPYMAPEQFRGEPVDSRVDIWAAAVVLYQLLTGEKPFDGGVTAVMHKVLNTEPLPPSQLSGSIPVAFDAVIARALAKRREDRFPDATALAQAIRAAAEGNAPRPALPGLPGLGEDATLVTGPGTMQRRPAAAGPAAATAPLPVPRQRRSPLPLVLGGVAALGAAGAAAWFLVIAPGIEERRLEQERQEAEQRLLQERERVAREARQAQEQAARDQAAREQAAREQAARDQAAREAAAREAAAREQATREAAARQAAEQAARDAAAREQAARDAAAREQAARERAAAEQAAREAAAREQAAREAAAREQAAREAAAREQAARDAAAREAAAREQAAREAAAREQAARDAAARERAARDAAAREQAAREAAAREQAARDQAAREQAAREQAAREQAAREQAAREQAAREQAERERAERERNATAWALRLDMREAAQAAARAAPCSLLAWSVTDQLLTIAGALRRGSGESMIRSELATRMVPDAAISLRLEPFDGPYCAALDTLRPVLAPAGVAPLVSIAGTMPLQKDELLRLAVQMPDWPAYLTVAYFMQSAEVATLVNARREEPGALVRLGDPQGNFQGWPVDEPYGTDLAVIIASDRPLFTTPRPDVERQSSYLAALSEALRNAHTTGTRILVRPIVVETVARRR